MDLLTVDSRQTRESGRPCFVELEDCTPLSLASFVFVLFPSYLKCPKSLSDLFAYPLPPLTYSFLYIWCQLVSYQIDSLNATSRMSRQIYNFSQNEYRG